MAEGGVVTGWRPGLPGYHGSDMVTVVSYFIRRERNGHSANNHIAAVF
jgi:hypothetical protein